MIKISVIIPVYNVEQYLGHCLDSVINQTYKNLEIICVNDASTDRSPLILEEYSKKNSRIVIVNNAKNSRLGPTRNHGMEIATGDYVHFLDSDDWLEPDAYEKLVNTIEKISDIDVIHFFWNDVSDKTRKIVSYACEDDKFLSKTINLYNDSNLLKIWDRRVWNKLYSNNFLKKNNLKFNDYPCHEDTEFSLLVILKAQKIYFLNEVLLNYRVENNKSLVGNCQKYYKYAVLSYNFAFDRCNNLDNDLKIKIMVSEYKNMFNILRNAYRRATLSYKAFYNILKNIDYSIFPEGELKCGVFLLYHDMKVLPEWLFCLKNMPQIFLLKYLPCVYKFLYIIKHKFFNQAKCL